MTETLKYLPFRSEDVQFGASVARSVSVCISKHGGMSLYPSSVCVCVGVCVSVSVCVSVCISRHGGMSLCPSTIESGERE